MIISMKVKCMYLLYSSEISFQSIYSKEMKADTLKDMAQKVSTSFIYKSSKLERIQMTIVIKIDKWCHIYTMECYRAIKKNELLIHTAKEMTLPDIMLSEKPGTEEHEVEKQA